MFLPAQKGRDLMQKRVQKLKLAKETVRSLDTPELRKVAGAIVYTDDTICCHSGDNACLQTFNRAD
jgi:hypothetical protein